MDMKTKLTNGGYLVCVSAVAALVGGGMYLATSLTGFLAGTTMNPIPAVCTALAIVLELVLAARAGQLSQGLADVLMAAVTVLLLVSFGLFALDRVSLAADVYFIPVNYPASEETALNLSIGGLGAYLVSLAALIAAGFREKLAKER